MSVSHWTSDSGLKTCSSNEALPPPTPTMSSRHRRHGAVLLLDEEQDLGAEPGPEALGDPPAHDQEPLSELACPIR